MIKVEDDGTVDGRKLHEVLGSKRQFADWIKQRIEKYDFVENVDYTVQNLISQNCESKKHGGDRRSIEYKLTVNMAKELSMIENNEIGKEFRKYFIMSEEIATMSEEITATIGQVNDALQSRSEAAQKSSAEVNSIKENINDTSKALEQVAITAQSQAELAQKLNDMIKKFII